MSELNKKPEVINVPRLIEATNRKKMLLFDFDGTLADTESLHIKAYNKCLREHQVYLTTEQFTNYIGKKEIIIYDMIKNDFDICFDNASFFEQRIHCYLELVKSEKLMPYPYFKELIKNREAKFNILTSNRLSVINSVLEIWGMRSIFDQVISAATNNIEKSDVIENIDYYFDFDNRDSVIFEDSNDYLKVAQKANILSVGIETNYNTNTLNNCDFILSKPTAHSK